MFRGNQIKVIEPVNFFFDSGGLGDNIAQMPVIAHVRDYAPNVIPHVWVPDYFLDLAKNLCPGVSIKNFTTGKTEAKSDIAGARMSCDQHTNLGAHLVDFAFTALINKQVGIEHRNYLKLNTKPISIGKFNLPKSYIVLATGFTTDVREMIPSAANGIIDYCKSKNIKVVTLGNKVTHVGVAGKEIKGQFKEEINFKDCINLVNKTTLLEAGKIIAGAKAIVGLDNGLLHLAGCTDVPIVAGFTTVLPEHRLPYRNDQLGWNCYSVEPEQSLECRGCQSKAIHVYDHKFNTCYYGDLKCIPQLTAEKYVAHLEKIL